MSNKINLSILFGCLSIFCFVVGFVATAFSPSNENMRIALVLLALLQLPGLVFAVSASCIGLVLYRRYKSRQALFGIVLGGVTIIMFIVSLLTVGGTAAVCISNKACSMLQHEWGCHPYPGSRGINILNPGFCAPPSTTSYM